MVNFYSFNADNILVKVYFFLDIINNLDQIMNYFTDIRAFCRRILDRRACDVNLIPEYDRRIFNRRKIKERRVFNMGIVYRKIAVSFRYNCVVVHSKKN